MIQFSQVPVDLISDRFGRPIILHAQFVTEMSLAFESIEDGCETEDDLSHLVELITAWYEKMAQLDIAR